MAVVRG